MHTLIDTRALVAGAQHASTAFAAALTEYRYAVCAPQFVRIHNKTTNKRNNSGRWTFVKKVLSSAFVGILLTSGSAVLAAGSVADPAVGTWKLNLAKSTFAGIQPYKSQIRVYSRSGQDITLKMTTVSAEGKETTTQTTYKLNGKDHPSMGNPDFDSLSGVEIDASTVEFTLKRAGKPVGKIRRTVSKDGQTLTINYVITNASGVQTSALTVFDKQ
jgi:hypothetical protein